MRVKFYQIILSFFFLISFPLPGNTEIHGRLYPLPIVEVEKILFQWLSDSGFEVTRRDLEGSQVQLKGIKENETRELMLRPHSPLASLIQPRFFFKGQPAQERIAELWTYLEDYLKGDEKIRMTIPEEVPARVKSHMESIVCIKVNTGAEEIQFTGFIVDRRGLIISTAHDLTGVQEVAIILANEQEKKGRLVKSDPHRDLTLIDIQSKLNSSISLARVRGLLRNGDRVYSISCPGNHRKFLSGTIDGPLRYVNRLPLWQVEMEIQPGSSGSPVFDSEGNLVAVVKGRYRGTHSTGFLIPLPTILEFFKEK